MKLRHSLFLFLPIISIIFLQCNGPNKKITSIPQPEGNSKKVLILAVDGGGIKGIIPAIFLDSIETLTKKQSYQLFDVIGGTSTGGIISVALTTPTTTQLPFTASDIVSIYQNNGSNIFVPQGCVVALCATYYGDNGKGMGIEPYLQGVVGDTTSLKGNYYYINGLKNARTQHLFTTSYQINSTGNSISNPVLGTDYGPYLFNWYDAIHSSADNYYLWEAARATSAAPTYFPVAQVGGGTGKQSPTPQRWVVDGGMMSNDPAVWGVTEALRIGIAKKLDDIIVISLGTGVYPGGAGVGIHTNASSITPDNGNWSATAWTVNKMYDLEGNLNDRGTIVNVILDAVQLVTNSQLEAMRKGGLTYYRLEPTLPLSLSKMDNIDPSNIKALEQAAQNYLATNGKATLDSIVKALK